MDKLGLPKLINRYYDMLFMQHLGRPMTAGETVTVRRVAAEAQQGGPQMMVKDLVKDLEKGDRTMEHLKTVSDRTEDNLMRMAQQLQNTPFQQANQSFASSYNSLAMQQSFMGAAANQQMLNRDPFGGIMGGSGGL